MARQVEDDARRPGRRGVNHRKEFYPAEGVGFERLPSGERDEPAWDLAHLVCGATSAHDAACNRTILGCFVVLYIGDFLQIAVGRDLPCLAQAQASHPQHHPISRTMDDADASVGSDRCQ